MKKKKTMKKKILVVVAVRGLGLMRFSGGWFCAFIWKHLKISPKASCYVDSDSIESRTATRRHTIDDAAQFVFVCLFA